jgi:prepilin-type N-terminal cleavage/methylation domain-containing protein
MQALFELKKSFLCTMVPTNPPPMSQRARRHFNGFTLIEMIGVLAVIAILASLLIPKIFESINNANISHAQLSYQTVKTATMEHFAKFYALNSINGVPFSLSGNTPQTDYDRILMTEGLLDKPFTLKIGTTTSTIQIRNASALAGGQPDPSAPSCGFDLDGDGANDIIGAQYLVEVLLTGVSDADARALNDRFDGQTLGEDANNPGEDRKGRLIYDKPGGSNPRTLRIYITHK